MSVRLHHGDPQGAKPKAEVVADILASWPLASWRSAQELYPATQTLGTATFENRCGDATALGGYAPSVA